MSERLSAGKFTALFQATCVGEHGGAGGRGISGAESFSSLVYPRPC